MDIQTLETLLDEWRATLEADIDVLSAETSEAPTKEEFVPLMITILKNGGQIFSQCGHDSPQIIGMALDDATTISAVNQALADLESWFGGELRTLYWRTMPYVMETETAYNIRMRLLLTSKTPDPIENVRNTIKRVYNIIESIGLSAETKTKIKAKLLKANSDLKEISKNGKVN